MEQLQALYSAGEYDAVWTRYLNEPRPDPEWHLYGALTAWRRGDPGRGKGAAELALQHHPTGTMRIRCLYIAGVCHREYGDFRMAMERFNECLRLLADCAELYSLLCGPLLYNRALTLHSYGQPMDTIASYERAITELRREQMDDYLRMALQNLAWTCCECGRFGRAETALEEAEPLCRTDDARWRQQTNCALLLGFTGQTDEALRICEEIHTTDGTPPDLRSLTASVSAEIALRRGNIEPALTMAQWAVEYATKQRVDSRCLVRAARILSEVKRARTGTGA